MIVKALLTSLLSLFLLTSCQQFKSLTAQDNTVRKSEPRQKKSREMIFLEDISVTPGQKMTTRHSTIGPAAPKRQTVTTASANNSYPAADLERGDWLQLKYSVILNSSPENLSNTSLLKLIDEWWGTRYSMGGTTKDGIDCSAFTQIIMGNVYGISLPRNSGDQYRSSQQIEDDQLQEGDLVFFANGRSISHVGVYLMNNKFVHASTSQGVIVSDLNESYWKAKYKGAGRVKSF
jgi:lipoprotein Spr